jgi:2'-5' RNA ligase
MDVLENWYDSFSKRVAPFRIELDRVYYEECGNYAIVGLNVNETPILRELHNEINKDLKDLVHDSSAPHDGNEYHFHLTIELGKTSPANPFKEFYEALPEKQVNLSFMAEHLALFFYTDGPIEKGSFICYKILPLTGK